MGDPCVKAIADLSSYCTCEVVVAWSSRGRCDHVEGFVDEVRRALPLQRHAFPLMPGG